MKQKLILIILIVIAYNTHSQSYGNYASSIGVSAGYAEDGYGIMATYNYHLDRGSYAQLSVFTAIAEDSGKNYKIPYTIFTVQPGYFKTIWKSRFQTFGFNLGGGAVFGYEVINGGDNTLDNGADLDAQSKFLFGLFAGIEAEISINNDLSILAKANQYYHATSDLGKLYPYAGIGLRYFLF